MTPIEAIEKLDSMQKQIVHGSNIFGDIAGVIRELEMDAKLGEQWNKDSSLEHWFPFAAEELEKLRRDNTELRKQNIKLSMACHLVLMFHSGSPWTHDKQEFWRITLEALLGPTHERDPKVVGRNNPDSATDKTWDGTVPTNEATTKNLCNAVRAALEGK